MRGVTLGYQQIPGIDYTESHSPVATDVAIRMAIGIALFNDGWNIHVIDIEAAFLEGKLDKPMFVEWLPGMIELGFLSKEEARKYVCMLTGGMYGNVQAALAFFVEYKNHLTKVMKLEQSLTDPCVFFKKDERGHLALMALTHVDDTLIAGNEEEIKNFKKGISRRFKFRDEGRLKKHLGVSYKWKQDEETGERLIEATMHTLVDEIISKYQEIKGSEPKEYSTPGKPNEHLRKGTEQEECLHIKEYRSLVGKYMYLVTKILPEGANAARI